MKDLKLEAFSTLLIFLSSRCINNETYFDKQLMYEINKALKSIFKNKKYSDLDRCVLASYKDKIDVCIRSSSNFSPELMVWLLFSYLKDECQDIMLRSRLSHINTLEFITKLERDYPIEAKTHHRILTKMIFLLKL